MTDIKETEPKKSLSLSRPGRLELKKTVDAGSVRQSFPHGRTKTVQVEVKRTRTYKLTPGMAYLYNEGDLHSPRRDGPTRLIRLEGTNMDKVKRLRFELAEQATA